MQEKATEEATDRQAKEKEKEKTTTEEMTTTKEKAKDQFATSAIVQSFCSRLQNANLPDPAAG